MTQRTLFSCLYGSRLYGTQTPTSDLDWKHIVLPDLDSLLLGNGVKNKDKKTNTVKNTRNTAEDVDETFIPIQVFARDYYGGQTYAMELAWAMEGSHAEQSLFNNWGHKVGYEYIAMTPFYLFVTELREKFLTSNIKAMMGYAVNQASLYSFKGERLNCVRRLSILLNHVEEYYGNAGDEPEGWSLEQIDDIPYFKKGFDDLAMEFPKYFRRTEYDIGAGVMKPCFMLLEKHLPFTNTYEHTMRVVSTLEAKYGNRADQATADNVDWKATMHALRIVNQGVELLSTGKMTFPFEQTYVDKLLSIKRGEVPLADVTAELNAGLDKMKALELSTSLQPGSNERRVELDVWLASWMRRFYNLP